MDTRQLRAFCAVVERESFSRAAASLGVTQPAVSQQVRALEKRLGVQLLDRSGRRVVPTDAGTQPLPERTAHARARGAAARPTSACRAFGPLTGALELGASTGPAAIVVPLLLCEFHQANPSLDIRLSVNDTQTVVSLVAERELELGIVGAARRRRAVEFEPFFSDEVILVCPPGHPFAGRTIAVGELPEIPLVLMQEGAGVRQLLEDELRRQGKRLRDLNVELVLGLQESVRSAVQAGYGATFISRRAVEADLASGTVAEIHVEGVDLQRQISIARATGRVASRAAEAFVEFARARLDR